MPGVEPWRGEMSMPSLPGRGGVVLEMMRDSCGFNLVTPSVIQHFPATILVRDVALGRGYASKVKVQVRTTCRKLV